MPLQVTRFMLESSYDSLLAFLTFRLTGESFFFNPDATGDLGIKTDVSLQLGSVKSHLTLDKMPRTQAESMLIWHQNENKINKPDIKLEAAWKVGT